MPHRGEAILEPGVRRQASTSVLQNRAFIELSRVLSSGDSAVLSSALPVIVRGASVPSAAVFTAPKGELIFAAAESVPLKLRAYLEEPAFTSAPDFLAQRALSERRTLIDAKIFGRAATSGASAALEDAAWQCGVAVPILAGSATLGALLVGARGAVDGSAVTFLEATANLLGAALNRPATAATIPPSHPGGVCVTCLAHACEALVSLGRDFAAQSALTRALCTHPEAPPEVDALLTQFRASDRHFHRLADMLLHLPSAPCSHVRRSSAMATAVDAAVLASRPALAAAHAEVQVLCAPPCEMEGDAELMGVAVRHLLVNAAEAFAAAPEHASVPGSRRRIRVCARYEGPNAAVHVEDSGPGVPQDLRARVFDPSVSTKGPGRGLGLAVARQIVESHGGWMELGTSELGGARLSIFVPARVGVLEELRKATTLPQLPAHPAGQRAARPPG